jgi:hypothetical protein
MAVERWRRKSCPCAATACASTGLGIYADPIDPCNPETRPIG